MLILGIETSCDETGIALYETDYGIIGEELYSQTKLHERYGGVVPELASRDHIRKVLPLTRQLLDKTQKTTKDLHGVAYTAGPGLVGALMVGAGIGRSMAWALGIPSLGVHHMEAHLLAPLLGDPKPTPPFVALLVSGGHTQLVQVNKIGDYHLLGESVDDAAGEAFDKTAKLLGLGYPGGPAIAKLAMQGVESEYKFPRPMTNRKGLDFSFSGLKTAVLNSVNQTVTLTDQVKANIAKAFEEAVVETLVIKCKRALVQTGLTELVVAGGVAANRKLRENLEQELPSVFYAPPKLCTDNGSMIAFAGHERLMAGNREALAITTRPRWPLEDLGSI